PRREHERLHRRRRPLVVDGGRRAGLRPVPRPVHRARRDRHLVLHPSGRHLAVDQARVHRDAGPRRGPRPDRPRRRATRDRHGNGREHAMSDGQGNGADGRGALAGRPQRSVWGRLYHGETNADFIGRKRIWFVLSGLLVLIGVVAFATRGFNLGIDFEGGVVWEVPAGDATVAEVRDRVAPFGLAGSTIQELESDEGRTIRVEAEPVDPETSDEITATLAELTGSRSDDIVLTAVGPSWGAEVSEKALRALIVFLVLVTAYITVRFEWKMALPTLVALFHDIGITAGFYAVTQIEVTPATVIALLTILGYSIYDGIVVFDKVD